MLLGDDVDLPGVRVDEGGHVDHCRGAVRGRPVERNALLAGLGVGDVSVACSRTREMEKHQVKSLSVNALLWRQIRQ
jgi:hypothetical protein